MHRAFVFVIAIRPEAGTRCYYSTEAGLWQGAARFWECPNEYFLKKIKEREGNSCRMTPRAALFFQCAEAVMRLNKDGRNCPKVSSFRGKRLLRRAGAGI